MLILPIALILWSILIFFLNTIIGIICGLKYISNGWDFNYNSYFNYLL